jgi:hypothetical protein
MRFVWHEVTYGGRVLSRWKLSDKWRDADTYGDRTYYRLETQDHQIFELYQGSAKYGLWVLSHAQD